MAKKIVWIIIIITLWALMFSTDTLRVEKKEKPWFCFPFETNNGEGYYYGIGYKVYITTQKNDKGIYKVKNAILGSWFSDLKGASNVQ